MIPLLLELLLLGRAVGRGIRDDAQFRAIMVALTLLLAGGTAFYCMVEGWSPLDALYFCVMTAATIGYGDLAPGTALSKGFTIGYAILSVGLFAGFRGEGRGARGDPPRHARATSRGVPPPIAVGLTERTEEGRRAGADGGSGGCWDPASHGRRRLGASDGLQRRVDAIHDAGVE